MLKVLCNVAIDSRAVAAASHSIAAGGPLGLRLRVLLSIVSAVLDSLALLEVVILAALNGCQCLLYLAGGQGNLDLQCTNLIAK